VCVGGVGRAPATTPNHRADGRPVAAPSNSKGSPPGTARHRLVLLGFWAGKGHAAQRSGPAPWKRSFCASRQDRNGTVSCRGHRHPALIVRGFVERNLAAATLWPSPKRGTNRGVDASGPSRAEAAKAGAGMVRWNRRKGQTKLALGIVRWTEGRVRPSWRRAWSVGADGRVKPGWRRAPFVGADGRVGRPAP
jgi:hypothetical protein